LGQKWGRSQNTKEVFGMIKTMSFKTERVELAKKHIIFQCFTGLGYTEIMNLNNRIFDLIKKQSSGLFYEIERLFLYFHRPWAF